MLLKFDHWKIKLKLHSVEEMPLHGIFYGSKVTKTHFWVPMLWETQTKFPSPPQNWGASRKQSLISQNLSYYTRHNCMFRYCWNNPIHSLNLQKMCYIILLSRYNINSIRIGPITHILFTKTLQGMLKQQNNLCLTSHIFSLFLNKHAHKQLDVCQTHFNSRLLVPCGGNMEQQTVVQLLSWSTCDT